MKNNTAPEFGFLNRRLLLAVALFSAGAFLATLGLSASATLPGRWKIVSSPNPAPNQNYLNGTDCISSTDCWAVGYHGYNNVAGPGETLIEHYDGSAWTIVPSPNPAAGQASTLNSVACVSSNDCWAVGYYVTASNSYLTLIEHYDGSTWSIVPSPNLSVTQANFLTNVTCVTGTDCWAVGYYSNGTAQQPLIVHYDGIAWAVVSSPSSSPVQTNFLNGVTCVSATDCLAVGAYSNQGLFNYYQTLIEHWDGSAWTIVPSPNTSPTDFNVLNSVTCASANDCWAVGWLSTATGDNTLVQHNNGSGWVMVSSPNNAAGQTNTLNSVTCVSSSDCWAVGFYYKSNNNIFQTLIEHYDGTAWSLVSSDNTAANEWNLLNSLTCTSATDCWAVGYSSSTTAISTLTERYAISPVPLNSLVSRKSHGLLAGSFDINMPLAGTTGIECRSGGANGNHTVVFTFANPLTSVGGASVSSGTGTVSSSAMDSSDARNYIVNLTGVTNAQTITVSLANVNDSAGNSSASVSASMGVLVGDVNASGRTDSGDVTLVRQKTVSLPDASTFRNDVNTSGRIDAGDVTVTRNNSVTVLPP